MCDGVWLRGCSVQEHPVLGTGADKEITAGLLETSALRCHLCKGAGALCGRPQGRCKAAHHHLFGSYVAEVSRIRLWSRALLSLLCWQHGVSLTPCHRHHPNAGAGASPFESLLIAEVGGKRKKKEEKNRERKSNLRIAPKTSCAPAGVWGALRGGGSCGARLCPRGKPRERGGSLPRSRAAKAWGFCTGPGSSPVVVWARRWDSGGAAALGFGCWGARRWDLGGFLVDGRTLHRPALALCSLCCSWRGDRRRLCRCCSPAGKFNQGS